VLEPVDGFLVKNALILKYNIFRGKKTGTPAFNALHTSTNALQCLFHGRYDIIVLTAAELYLCALCSCTWTGEDISLFDRSCGPRCTHARVAHLYTRLCRLERHRNAKKPFRRFWLIYAFLGHALSYIIILYNTVLSVCIHQAFVRSRFRCVVRLKKKILFSVWYFNIASRVLHLSQCDLNKSVYTSIVFHFVLVEI